MNAVRALIRIKEKIEKQLHLFRAKERKKFLVGEKTSACLKDQLNLEHDFLGKNFEELYEIMNNHYKNESFVTSQKILCVIGNLSDIDKYKVIFYFLKNLLNFSKYFY
jgi:hypothetical protein